MISAKEEMTNFDPLISDSSCYFPRVELVI